MAVTTVLKPLSRTLQLKPIQFSAQKPGREMNLVQLMDILHDQLPTVGARTWTVGITLEDGSSIPQLCFFFNNYQKLDEKTSLFEVWSYEPGLIPLTLTPDPDSLNAVIDSEAIRQGEGNGAAVEPVNTVVEEARRAEFIQISHVLVFGSAAIIESTRNTGGVNYIQRYINKKAKELALGQHTTFYFTDAVSGGLQHEINAGGGAVGFTVGMSRAAADSDSQLLGLLTGIRGYMPSSGMLTVDWRSKDRLPTAKVVEAFAEAKDLDEIENVIIHLDSGSSIRNMSKYKIKRTIEVTDVGGKNPDRGELCRKMVLYLEELTTLDDNNARILDDNGVLVNNEIFIPDSRRSKKREESQ